MGSDDGVFELRGLNRPSEAVITNDGYSAIADWLSPTRLDGSLLFISPVGTIVAKRTFEVNLGRLALDEDHALLFVTTAHSDSTRARLLCYEIRTGELLWRRWAPEAAAEVRVVPAERCILIGHPYKACGSEYTQKRSIDGKLMERWARSPYEAISLGEINRMMGKLEAARRCFQAAADSDIAPSFRAKAYRSLGEIAETSGDEQIALLRYRQAHSLYPKIGVKRKIAALQQAWQIVEHAVEKNEMNKTN